MHQNGPGDAARLFVIRQRNIVADDQHLHVVAESARFPRRQTEVKPIAGVVFDDQQAARLAGHCLNGGEHRVDARRGERIHQTTAVSMPLAIKPTCAGSWPAPPPEITATLFLFRSRRTTTRIAGSLQTGEVIPRAGDNGTLNHIVDEAGALLVKKELRHSGS